MSLEVVVRNPAHPEADIVIADAELAWTVLAVKRRIAAVHPSHPVCVAAVATLVLYMLSQAASAQRIVFMGALLDDGEFLRDVVKDVSLA